MTEIFDNAPLVELVAEVRWNPPETPDHGEPLDAFQEVEPDAASEPLYRALGARLAEVGFSRSERVIPPGFPIPPTRAVYRYLASGDVEGQVIFQAGPGVFSINAIPPYKSWAHFRPHVENGLRILLDSWTDSNRPEELGRLTLRYIDAFRDDFLEERTRYAFITDTLGFRFELPSALREHLEADEHDVFFQMTSALKNGGEVAVRAGHATVNNTDAVVFDMAVNKATPTELDSSAVLQVLDSAHEIINRTFVGMTKSVAHVLRGEER